MLHRVYRDEKLSEIPVFKDILKLYITPEILRYVQTLSCDFHCYHCFCWRRKEDWLWGN